MGVTEPIFSIPLFSQFFRIVETHASYWISHLYFIGVTAAEQRWHLSNNIHINVMQRIWQVLKKFSLQKNLTNGTLVTPTPGLFPRYCPSASEVILSHYLITTNQKHYDDNIMDAIASQITSLTIVYSIVYSGAGQSKHQSSASLAFVWGIHRGPVNSPHKWPVTRKMFPFDDVIMETHKHNFLELSVMAGYWLGNHFNVTGLLWGNPLVQQQCYLKMADNAKLWWFAYS